MKKISEKLTIIKYGTETLVRENASGEFCVDHDAISEHGVIIDNYNNPVLVVSSGAVGFGRALADFGYIKDSVARKRALAAAGNPHLSINWDKAIAGKIVLQGLITRKEFKHKDSREALKDIIFNIYQNPLYAVIQLNDNDFITDEELRESRGGDFGDNDELTALVAELCAEMFEGVEVIINTGSDGVMENGETIAELATADLSDEKIAALCGDGKTEMGTGGMMNKLKIFRDLAEGSGISIRVINGKKPEQLKKVLAGEISGTLIRR